MTNRVRNWLPGLRNDDLGALPAILGFVALVILFTVLSPYFFTERNFANLVTQAATLVMLAMAMVFVILLGEIDLSAGVTSGVSMCLFVVLTAPGGLAMHWVLALAIALLAGIAIGAFIGFFVARIGIPSFVVTLGLFLGLQGLELILIGSGGVYRITTPAVLAIMNSNLPNWGGWLMLAAMLGVSATASLRDRGRHARAGLANPAITQLWMKLGAILLLGGVVVFVLNLDRGTGTVRVSGVPVVAPITLAILWAGTFVLDRTKFGRYIYAIGGNAEAARRAGVKVVLIRWYAFMVCSALAVVSGLFGASRVGSVDAAFGRDIVLSGVAAAVVGGVSLFGGRGRLLQAAIGALVVAVITNGLGLLNLPGGVNYLVTGGVLILAATVDAVSRARSGRSMSRS
jgi:D-xylose transport system permease protein